MRAGKPANAIAELNKSLWLNPVNDNAYNDRGSAYLKMGNYAQAVDDYNKAIHTTWYRDPMVYGNRGAAYFYMGQYTRAIDDLSKAMESGMDPTANAYRFYYCGLRARAYRRTKQYEKADEDINYIMQKLVPKSHFDYCCRGIAYYETKHYQKAIDDCNKAISLDPTDPAAYNWRGRSFLKLERYPDAVVDFTKTIDLKPFFIPFVYILRAEAYEKMYKPDLALKDKEMAAKLGYKPESASDITLSK